MAFKPEIKFNPKISADENLKAIINFLNFCLREMTVGRVPMNKEMLESSLNEAKETEAMALELAADHEARLCKIELGV